MSYLEYFVRSHMGGRFINASYVRLVFGAGTDAVTASVIDELHRDSCTVLWEAPPEGYEEPTLCMIAALRKEMRELEQMIDICDITPFCHNARDHALVNLYNMEADLNEMLDLVGNYCEKCPCYRCGVRTPPDGSAAEECETCNYAPNQACPNLCSHVQFAHCTMIGEGMR